MENKPLELPRLPHCNLNIEVDDVSMDNFCTYYQANHPEKNFPQWMNSMNLVEGKFIDDCKKNR